MYTDYEIDPYVVAMIDGFNTEHRDLKELSPSEAAGSKNGIRPQVNVN